MLLPCHSGRESKEARMGKEVVSGLALTEMPVTMIAQDIGTFLQSRCGDPAVKVCEPAEAAKHASSLYSAYSEDDER